MVKILFVGDIYGRPGRQVASQMIPRIREERGIDVCIANGENIAGGFGLTESSASKLFSYGVDVITTGNHVWDRKESINLLNQQEYIIRPANFPPGVPGKGWTIFDNGDGLHVGVINLQGRIFLPAIDCPFRATDAILDHILPVTPVVLVDFHAEATAEKIALGRYCDGRVSAVVGTHTHVMTADEQVFPKGTAFITDVGMTGPHDSIIGVRVDQSMSRIIKQIPVRFTPAEGGLHFSGVVIDIDESTGRANAITRLFIPYTNE